MEKQKMIRSALTGLAVLALFVVFPACGDETPAEHEHVCTDGELKCEGDQFRVCAADEWGAPQACPTGQACMVMDGGAMCM